MLTGQESIAELVQRSKRVAAVLNEFGITLETSEHLKFKNLAHAAVVLKQPLKKILTKISAVTGEEVKKLQIKGLDSEMSGMQSTDERSDGQSRRHVGLKKGFPVGVDKVVLIHSGKGGVGKTFVTVNLAAALAARGLRVGILDADIDCPNVLKVLRLDGKLVTSAQKKILPLEKFGIKIVSMAPMLESEDQVTMWRGPIVSRALEQLLHDTDWGELDFLLVDLPPGTSDVPISALNMLEGAEMLVVTTPHELALLDAKKSLGLARTMNVKVAALVENMASDIFGEGGVEELAKEIGVGFGGTISLRREYALIDKEGRPAALSHTELANMLVKTVL